MPKEIIIYRNPGEKLLWDFLLSEAATKVIVYACVVGLAFLVGYVLRAAYLDNLWRIRRYYRNRKWNNYKERR